MNTNNIRLTHYPDRGFVGAVKTEINGIELQEVREIKLLCPIDGLATLEVEQFVGPDIDVTLEGLVYPKIVFVDDSFELHVEHASPTGPTRYWVTRR